MTEGGEGVEEFGDAFASVFIIGMDGAGAQ